MDEANVHPGTDGLMEMPMRESFCLLGLIAKKNLSAVAIIVELTEESIALSSENFCCASSGRGSE